jgi:hypothetical protein
VILAHHGGEVALLQAALASAGSVPVLLLLFRTHIVRLGRRFPRQRGGRSEAETRP